jgi:hypothetical protein
MRLLGLGEFFYYNNTSSFVGRCGLLTDACWVVRLCCGLARIWRMSTLIDWRCDAGYDWRGSSRSGACLKFEAARLIQSSVRSDMLEFIASVLCMNNSLTGFEDAVGRVCARQVC